uniref:RING-type domain-containing protein n=2 Tax=Parascaris univalens TaxID=6257 RepID=A0A915B9A3_PARUN
MSTEVSKATCRACGRSCGCSPTMDNTLKQTKQMEVSKTSEAKEGRTHGTHHHHHHHQIAHSGGHRHEYKMLDEEEICVICGKEKATMRFNPCRHRNSCTNCAPRLTNCPKCSEFIMYRERQLRS